MCEVKTLETDRTFHLYSFASLVIDNIIPRISCRRYLANMYLSLDEEGFPDMIWITKWTMGGVGPGLMVGVADC